jgi:hypothetical protein
MEEGMDMTHKRHERVIHCSLIDINRTLTDYESHLDINIKGQIHN